MTRPAEVALGGKVEHEGKTFEVVRQAGHGCTECAACHNFDLCCKLPSCETDGRDDGEDVMLQEVVG